MQEDGSHLSIYANFLPALALAGDFVKDFSFNFGVPVQRVTPKKAERSERSQLMNLRQHSLVVGMRAYRHYI